MQIDQLMAKLIRGGRIVAPARRHKFGATAKPALAPINASDLEPENGETCQRQQQNARRRASAPAPLDRVAEQDGATDMRFEPSRDTEQEAGQQVAPLHRSAYCD